MGLTSAATSTFYYHRITMDQKLDVFETFQLDGMGIAKADENYTFKRLVAPDGTHEFWKGDEPGFGVFIQEIDGWLFVVKKDLYPLLQSPIRNAGPPSSTTAPSRSHWATQETNSSLASTPPATS